MAKVLLLDVARRKLEEKYKKNLIIIIETNKNVFNWVETHQSKFNYNINSPLDVLKR